MESADLADAVAKQCVLLRMDVRPGHFSGAMPDIGRYAVGGPTAR